MVPDPTIFTPERVAQLVELCREAAIRRMSVFGSCARGEAQPESDLDLLYEVLPDAEWGVSRRWEFRRAFQSVFGREVDLLELESLRPYSERFLRRTVLSEALVVYEAAAD